MNKSKKVHVGIFASSMLVVIFLSLFLLTIFISARNKEHARIQARYDLCVQNSNQNRAILIVLEEAKKLRIAEGTYTPRREQLYEQAQKQFKVYTNQECRDFAELKDYLD